MPASVRPDWESLVTENEQKLFRAALAILGDPAEAEDAVQDAFLRYLEKAPRDLKSPAAWLMRVTVNGCKSRLRLKWRQVLPLSEALENQLRSREEREELTELWALAPADRAVIHLYYYEGYATAEIAAMTGLRPAAVRSRLSRARQRLRKLLADSGEGGSIR